MTGMATMAVNEWHKRDPRTHGPQMSGELRMRYAGVNPHESARFCSYVADLVSVLPMPTTGVDLFALERVFTAEMLKLALKRTKGKKAAASRLLAINRTTFSERCLAFGVSAELYKRT